MIKNSPSKKYLTTKNIFIISIIVTILTILGIWLLGIGKQRTLFENSLLSTSLLSISFFLFLSINLYNGTKLKDNLGKITDKINKNNIPDISGIDLSSNHIPDVGEGIGGLILGLILWFIISVVLIFLITFLGAVLWIMILIFTAMLYWIFFRALRLVFKNSTKTHNNLILSVFYAFVYTILYNFWIYGIILTSHYFLN
ncbi:hypothetical protein [Chishuiella sp.]|uniref:hypothetical protein n=1 Tax=Chishuiella sp. TaxID=1969467 RepID=UPI0028AAB708|nr:hypothetical protein [Chishuiella sp.]